MRKFLAVWMILALLLTAAGCNGSGTERPPEDPNPAPTQDDSPADVPDSTLTYEDAYQLAAEKLEEGTYALEEEKDISDETTQGYFVFTVTKGSDVIGGIAVQKESGDLFYYDGSEILPYAEFPLYDPQRDAVCAWDGEYTNQENGYTLTLYQADANSFEFYLEGEHSISGIARVQGNTASCGRGDLFTGEDAVEGDLSFRCEEEGVFTVSGDDGIAGTYQG